jgi:hypothetical protein
MNQEFQKELNLTTIKNYNLLSDAKTKKRLGRPLSDMK